MAVILPTAASGQIPDGVHRLCVPGKISGFVHTSKQSCAFDLKIEHFKKIAQRRQNPGKKIFSPRASGQQHDLGGPEGTRHATTALPGQIPGLGPIDPGLGLAWQMIEIDRRGQDQPGGAVEPGKKRLGLVLPAHPADSVATACAAAGAGLDMMIPQMSKIARPGHAAREKGRGLVAVAVGPRAQGHDQRAVHERGLRTNSARTNSSTCVSVKVQSVST